MCVCVCVCALCDTDKRNVTKPQAIKPSIIILQEFLTLAMTCSCYDREHHQRMSHSVPPRCQRRLLMAAMRLMV